MSQLPSSDQLLADPELAVLHALGAALAATQRALLAAHPELEEDLAGDRPLELPGAGWIADSILTHINGLEQSIQRYRQEVQRARRCQLNDELPF